MKCSIMFWAVRHMVDDTIHNRLITGVATLHYYKNPLLLPVCGSLHRYPLIVVDIEGQVHEPVTSEIQELFCSPSVAFEQTISQRGIVYRRNSTPSAYTAFNPSELICVIFHTQRYVRYKKYLFYSNDPRPVISRNVRLHDLNDKPTNLHVQARD